MPVFLEDNFLIPEYEVSFWLRPVSITHFDLEKSFTGTGGMAHCSVRRT